jgi:hypothetical protein
LTKVFYRLIQERFSKRVEEEKSLEPPPTPEVFFFFFFLFSFFFLFFFSPSLLPSRFGPWPDVRCRIFAPTPLPRHRLACVRTTRRSRHPAGRVPVRVRRLAFLPAPSRSRIRPLRPLQMPALRRLPVSPKPPSGRR